MHSQICTNPNILVLQEHYQAYSAAVAARHNKLRQSQSKQSKENQAEVQALEWSIITLSYPLVPHPQSLTGEGLLACSSFVILIGHHASVHMTFTLIKELDFSHPVSSFLSSCLAQRYGSNP